MWIVNSLQNLEGRLVTSHFHIQIHDVILKYEEHYLVFVTVLASIEPVTQLLISSLNSDWIQNRILGFCLGYDLK